MDAFGDAFEDLNQRIYDKGFPCQTYDLCYRAQADSKKNRQGGRVNQGIIEFLFPLIISQVANQHTNINEIVNGVPAILENAIPEDTVYLQKMQNLFLKILKMGR